MFPVKFINGRFVIDITKAHFFLAGVNIGFRYW